MSSKLYGKALEDDKVYIQPLGNLKYDKWKFPRKAAHNASYLVTRFEMCIHCLYVLFRPDLKRHVTPHTT